MSIKHLSEFQRLESELEELKRLKKKAAVIIRNSNILYFNYLINIISQIELNDIEQEVFDRETLILASNKNDINNKRLFTNSSLTAKLTVKQTDSTINQMNQTRLSNSNRKKNQLLIII